LAGFAAGLGKMAFKAAVKACISAAKKVVKDQIKGAFESLVKEKAMGFAGDAGILYLLSVASETAMAEAYANKLMKDNDKTAAAWAESLVVDLAKAADPTGISGLVSAMTAHSGSCDQFAIEPFPCASKECLRLDGVLECEIHGDCPWHPIKEDHRCKNYKKEGQWNRKWHSGVASVFGCNELCRTSRGCDVFSFSESDGVCMFMAEHHELGCVAEGWEGYNMYYKFQVPGPPKVRSSFHTCTGSQTPANSLSECHQMALSAGGKTFAYKETDTNIREEVMHQLHKLSILQLPVDPQLEAPSSPNLEAEAMSMAQGSLAKPTASRPRASRGNSATGSAASINGAGANSVGSGTCTVCSKKMEFTSASETVYDVVDLAWGKERTWGIERKKNKMADVQPGGVDAGTPLKPGMKCKWHPTTTITMSRDSAKTCNFLCATAGFYGHFHCDSFSWSSTNRKCVIPLQFGGCEVQHNHEWDTYAAWFDTGSAIRFNKMCSNYKVRGKYVRTAVWSGVKTAAACKLKCVNAGSCRDSVKKAHKYHVITFRDRISWNWKTGGCIYIPYPNECREEHAPGWAIFLT